MTDFVHLHLHSEYSLLDGACRIKELVMRVKELGQRAVAVTDHGNMFAAIEFYNAARAAGIKPIIGCEVYVAPGSRFDKLPGEMGKPYHLILLCENNEGYRNLIKLVSAAYTEGFYNRPRVDKQLLRQYSKGLICLSACIAGELPRKLMNGDYEGAKAAALEHLEIFGEGNYFIELQDHSQEDRRAAQQLIRLSHETGIPLVVTNDCHYLRREDADAQGILMCISTNTTINDPERMQFPSDEFYVKSGDEMAELYPSQPQAVTNTVAIADRCNVEIEFRNTKLPYFHIDGVEDNARFLREMCYKGLERLYPTVTKEARERLEYELSVIIEMGYTNYYLIVWDFINYAKTHGIPVGPGRGSGAGSLCAYCIGITGIDPLKYNLLFERFLNPERKTMPDFDIDFCMEGRQQVIDYVIRKYGADHVAQIITFGTLGPKQAVRDVARAMGLPYKTGDTVAKLCYRNLPLEESARSVPELKTLMDRDPEIKALIENAVKIEGMPRNCSTHAAGVIIAPEPVDDLVPLYARDGVVSTQYTMTILESLGLLKIDFLGLRNLTIIKHTCEYIHRTDPGFDIETVPLDDREVYEMLAEGRTEGVFQFESAGMTSVVARLRPTGIEDLIAVISLYRPGPMDSIPTYIRNRHDPSRITYKHPLLKDILEVTYGCIVYQEQVMQIFRTLAGYSYGRADMVRKAMSKKKAADLERERSSFIHGDDTCCGCVANGLSPQLANEIFDEMTSFASYAFNKSHAAAYATVAYRTAYLKCHYYREYMSALMTNALIESIDKLHTYIIDLARAGVELLPIDINKSERGFVPDGTGIRFALGAVKSLGDGAIASIVRERERGGPFRSLQDFCMRINGRDISTRVIEALIKSGAFDSFPNNRREMLESCEEVMRISAQAAAQRMEGQLDMFGNLGQDGDPLDIKLTPCQEFTQIQLLEMEYEVLGMYISAHPLDNYAPYALAYKCMTAPEINELTDEDLPENGKPVTFLGVITGKRILKTKKGDMMCFLRLEDKFSSVETVVFPSLYIVASPVLGDHQLVFVKGRLTAREDEPVKILADHIDSIDGMMRASAVTPVFVRVASTDKAAQTRIRSCLASMADPSGAELRLFFSDLRKTVALREVPRIRVTAENLKLLQQAAGEDNVAFTERKS